MVADAALARIRRPMTVADLAEAERILHARLGPGVRVGFPIAPLTTFRIGGPAALFVEAQATRRSRRWSRRWTPRTSRSP